MNIRSRSGAVLCVLALSAVVASACLSGCRARQPVVNTAEAANPEGRATVIEDRRLVRDPRLASAVQLVGLAEGTNAAGLKVVEAELFNATNGRVAIRYRVEWFGRDGLSVHSSMAVWRDRALLGGERARISAVAPSEQAVDFQLEIIPAR